MDLVQVKDGEVVETSPSNRAEYVKQRLVAINRDVSERYIENGLLLREVKDKALYRSWGYESFDDAINGLQDRGDIDFGARNARNFIAVVDMIDTLGIDPDQVKRIAISKLRELAMLPAADQRRMLEAASDMTVGEVQAEAKRIRDKVAGRDVDETSPWTFMFTSTQHSFVREVLKDTRVVFSIDDNVSDANVLVDVILADYKSGLPDAEVAEINEQLGGQWQE